MTPSSALSEKKLRTLAGTAVELLEESRRMLMESGTPADLYLRKTFRLRRCLGSRDRHFITEAVFAFYRWALWISKALPENASTEKCLLAAFAAEGIRPPAWDLWCGDDPEPGERIFRLSAPEERFEAFTGVPVSSRDMLPEWMLPLLAPGAETEYLPYLKSRPPVWIRIQHDAESVFREFEKTTIGFSGDDRLPQAFRLSHHAKINLQLLESFRAGRFEIQDFSSQCIGAACMAKPGSLWWDVCAGGGGKTLLLASAGARVIAGDIRESCLEEIRRRAARGGFSNIRVLPREEAEKRMFDGVLVDAPCSSSGRWRRNPEARLTMSRERVDELCRIQRSILDSVCSRVKPGGLLVYGTCSVFGCENRGTAEHFLSAHPEFEPCPFPFAGKEQWCLQSFPSDADCDGGFRAVFRRKEGPNL